MVSLSGPLSLNPRRELRAPIWSTVIGAVGGAGIGVVDVGAGVCRMAPLPARSLKLWVESQIAVELGESVERGAELRHHRRRAATTTGAARPAVACAIGGIGAGGGSNAGGASGGGGAARRRAAAAPAGGAAGAGAGEAGVWATASPLLQEIASATARFRTGADLIF